jgi:hypothetical protein
LIGHGGSSIGGEQQPGIGQVAGEADAVLRQAAARALGGKPLALMLGITARKRLPGLLPILATSGIGRMARIRLGASRSPTMAAVA